MSKYSEQDLKYAAEFRDEIHREALAIVRKTHPGVTEVVDRHPVEDYFQQNWEYPGEWHTIVAVPYGYKSRKALVDAIVRDTLSGRAPKTGLDLAQGSEDAAEDEYAGYTEQEEDTVYTLPEEYPDPAVEYCVVKDEHYRGYESHRKALKTAYLRLCGDRKGDPDRAAGKSITAEELFSSDYKTDKLNYRKAFLYPPHGNSCTGRDFARVNAALFPNGTDALTVYEWDTDWSEYFDEGREWWGTLCLTVYDGSLDRFVVFFASATD